MQKPKYKIIYMNEHELNQAYVDGYEFLCYFNEYHESTYSNGYNGVTNNGQNIQISIPQHNGNQTNKVLMQLSAAGEALYGKPRNTEHQD